MNLTIDSFLGHAGYVKSVSDRALATERKQDHPWQIYGLRVYPYSNLQSPSYGGDYRSAHGFGIDRNAGRVLRGRAPMGDATLEVADIADRFQMDNDRLEKLSDVIKQVNAGKLDYDAVVNTLVDDFREASIAPYKACGEDLV